METVDKLGFALIVSGLFLFFGAVFYDSYVDSLCKREVGQQCLAGERSVRDCQDLIKTTCN